MKGQDAVVPFLPFGQVLKVKVYLVKLSGLLQVADHLGGVSSGELAELCTVGFLSQFLQLFLAHLPPLGQVHNSPFLGHGHFGNLTLGFG